MRGSWPQLPNGELNLSPEMREEVNQCFPCALSYNMMSIGKMQPLKMLIALQCPAGMGARPAPGYICQCVELITHLMMAMGIVFTAHTVLVSAPSTHSSWSTSLEMDILIADVSSLLLSVGSARNLARKVNAEAEMEILTAALTGTPSKAPTGDTTIDKKV